MVSVAAPDRGTAGAAVRHILVQADSTKQDTEGKEVDLPADEIAKNFADAKAEAEKILKEWKDGEAMKQPSQRSQQKRLTIQVQKKPVVFMKTLHLQVAMFPNSLIGLLQSTKRVTQV
jgi:hypothetical protein